MNNRIVLFSNIKGGVGKTTLCAIFASYLAEKGLAVLVVDADLQASLYRHRQREIDVDPDVQPPPRITLFPTTTLKQSTTTIQKLDKPCLIDRMDCLRH